METGRLSMRPDDAPPGFWRLGDRPCLIQGVELESNVATRFFQSVDPYPPEWGVLRWRIALNKIVAGRAGSPTFRTFYPGVEWNLNHPDYRWFLSGWLKWEGRGPQCRNPGLQVPARVVGDTALFRIAWMPKAATTDVRNLTPEPDFDRPLFLRSRVDARDRRRISETLRAQPEPRPASDSATIVLDDVVRRSG